MAFRQVLLLQLLLVSLASASHHIGATTTWTVRGKTPDGRFIVDFHNRDTYDRCIYSHNWACYNGQCGSQVKQQKGTIDSSPNAPSHENLWCETETVQTRYVPSDQPFALRSASCCWIKTRNSVNFWRLLTAVDLGQRSDTKEPNRSPDVAILPVIRVPQNCPRTYKLTTFDADGDKVGCRYGNQRYVECSGCVQPPGFHVDQNSCELRFNSGTYDFKSYAFEMVVEDFPKSQITLTYSDGSKTIKYPTYRRRKRQQPWSQTTTAAPTTTTTALPWWLQWTTTTAAPTTTTTAAPTTTTTAAPTTTTTAAPTTTTTALPWWLQWTTTTAAPTTTTTAAPTTTTTAVPTTTTTAAPTTTTTAVPTTTTTAAPTTTTTAAPTTTTTAAPTTTTTAAPTTTTTAAPTTTTTAAPTTTTTSVPTTTTTAAPTTTTTAAPTTTTTAAPTTSTTAAPTTTTTAAPTTTTTAAPTTTTTAAPTTTTTAAPTTTTTAAPTTTTTAAPTTTTTAAPTTTTTAAPTTTTTAAPTTTTTAAPTTTTTAAPTTTTTAAPTTTTTAAPTTTTTAAPTTTTTAARPLPITFSASPLSKLPLHFSLLVDRPAPSCQPGLYLPQYLSPTPKNRAHIHAEVGKEVQIRVKAKSSHATLQNIIFSGPQGIKKRTTINKEFIISWMPSSYHLGNHYVICFAVESVRGINIYQSDMRCVIVDVETKQVESNVICSQSTMRIEIKKSSFPRLSEDHLRLNDPSNIICSLKTHSNSTHVIGIVPLHGCGTQIEEDNDYLKFKNEITTFDNLKDVITRKHLLEVQFYCQYPKRGNVTQSFLAHRKSITVWDKGFGRFTYQYEFYHNAQFHTMIDPKYYPLEYELGGRIFMQIEAKTTVKNTQLFVESCRAAPYDNPNSKPVYSIIENGCMEDSTVQIHTPDHPRQFRFSMEAFKFIGLHDQVYITCQVMMCQAGNPASRCSRGCMRNVDRRKREAATQTSMHLISQGPLRLSRSAVRTESPVMNLNLNMAFIAGCLLAAVGMISGVTVYKVRGSRVKYQPLPTSEN